MSDFFRTQFFVFGFSCLLGVVLGFLYDCFRLIRMLINPKNIFIFMQDIIYFFVSAVVTFFFVLVFNNGESRFYILAGEGIGWIVYHLTFGEFIYKCSESIVRSLDNYTKKILVKFKSFMARIHKNIIHKFVKK